MVVVGLPSAASGESQVAGYLEKQKQLKDAGVDEVLVYSTEGGADMEALATRCSGSMVTVLVDERMHLTRSLGMSITYTDSRSKRYAMVVKDGMAKAVWISYTAGARNLRHRSCTGRRAPSCTQSHSARSLHGGFPD